MKFVIKSLEVFMDKQALKLLQEFGHRFSRHKDNKIVFYLWEYGRHLFSINTRITISLTSWTSIWILVLHSEKKSCLSSEYWN